MPIVNVGFIDAVVIAHAGAPVSTMVEALNMLKARPNSLTIGSFGPGSVGHLYAEWLAKEAGARFVHVPFKGAGPAMQAAIGGQVDVALVGVGPIIPLVKAGKLKPLAVTGERRSSYLPDTPTFGELGLEFVTAGGRAFRPPRRVCRAKPACGG